MASAIIHIKGIILTHMTASPELKKAVMNVLNCIDEDMTAIDFDSTMSDATEQAIQDLDNVLIDETEVTVDAEVVEGDEILSRESLLDNSDEDSEVGG